MLVFVLASGVEPRWSWLELPLLIALLGVFATGIAMLLSALFVRFRDVQPIWEVVSQMLFYASPILYAIDDDARRDVQHLLMCNPLAAIARAGAPRGRSTRARRARRRRSAAPSGC